MSQSLYPLAAFALLIPFQPAVAEIADSAEAAATPPPTAENAHQDHDAEIVVTGTRRNAGDVLGGVSVLDHADLTRDVRPSLGETLAALPGVSSTSFGPTASAPILRGLSGDRVRVLTDGIGSLDLSASGPDHAIAINPLTAERIEVLRGPSALLFGSSAIGGVVNVIDSRIPRKAPDGLVGVDALGAYGSAANERSANLGIDLPLGAHFVAHADGSYSKSDDLRTSGHLLSDGLRHQAMASPDPAIRALADLAGDLPNTAAKTSDLAAGVAYVNGGWNVGISIGHHRSKYGVPIRFSLDPDIAAETPTIDARQTRGDIRIDIPLGGRFSRIGLRGGIANYRHDEIEASGAIGSSFFSKGAELRAELVQSERSGWGGTSGIQLLDRNARIRGEEKFLPDSRQKQVGLFTLQTLVRGRLRLEAGARLESSRLNATADAFLGTGPAARKFTTVSASAGASYEFSRGWRSGLSLSSSARAPSIDELFANGPHLASQSFERGNAALDPERSLSAEASLRHTSGPLHVTANLFYSRFSNFIFQTASGGVEDGLPVFEYRQGQATYSGLELQADAKFGRAFGVDWGAEVITDAVRATIKRFGPAPQIPPFRILAALTGARGPFDGRLEIERAAAQHRIAANETPTPGYSLVNVSLDWHPSADNPEFTLSLAGNNLFDVVARRHSSLLKDYAPLAGRDIRLSARLGL
ncbi:MAG: TonB-dependent receptor [Sphingomicrobium sp.]